MTLRRAIMLVFSAIRIRHWMRRRGTLRIHFVDPLSDVLWVYGWRDVLSRPVAATRVKYFRQDDRVRIVR